MDFVAAMQITDISVEGLKHEFNVVVSAEEIDGKIVARLKEVGAQARLPGFRPGKVPLKVLRDRFGASVLSEVLEDVVNDTSAKALDEKGVRPALQPEIEIATFKEGENLEYKLSVEVLPEISAIDYQALALERLRPEITDEMVNTGIERIGDQQRKTEAVEREAVTGDQLIIDFVGSIDGTEFPGGTGKGYTLELGSGTFIPGFEDQLLGAKPGSHVSVNVAFPADYGHAELAGKAALFEVDVQEVREKKPLVVDDELAKAIGMESLEELKTMVRERLEQDYGRFARQKLKRALLDQLALKVDFPLPTSMVTREFDTIWAQMQEARKENPESAAEDAGKSEDELRTEYGAIAERRVRLGLLLAEIGRTNNITVTQAEENRALADEAYRHRGHESEVVKFYRSNPNAMASLRAPIYEDKVVDFIIELAKVSDKVISVEELLKDDSEAA